MCDRSDLTLFIFFHLLTPFVLFCFHSVVVVLAVKTYVYNFADLTLIDCLDTCNNPNGLCALNS